MGDAGEPVWTAEEHREFEAQVERAIAAAGHVYQETNNPVYAWLALSQANTARVRRRFDHLPTSGLNIPEWCANYFAHVAQAVMWSAHGLDFFAKPRDPSEPGAVSQPLQRLPTKQVASGIMRAIGITGQGFNNLEQFQKDQVDMHLALHFEQLQAVGFNYDDATEQVAKKVQSKDQSIVRKQVTRGRRLMRYRDAVRVVVAQGTGKTSP